MPIEIILDGEAKTVTRQELFDLAARGIVGPQTPVNVNGKLTTAAKIKDIVFSAPSPPPVVDVRVTPPPADRVPRSFWLLSCVMIVLLLACFALLLVSVLQKEPENDVARRTIPPQTAEEVPPPIEADEAFEDIPSEPEAPIDPQDEGEAVESDEESPDDMPAAADAPEKKEEEKRPDAVPPAPLPDSFRIVHATPEPIEATEARQQFDEKVEQAAKPYREELEKELAAVKDQGDLQSVLRIEAELKRLRDGTPTGDVPEKRALGTLKSRCRKGIESARDDYRKRLTEIVKELVQADRVGEAKIVQEQIDHFDPPRAKMLTPKRSSSPAVPVVRMALELTASGKGRFQVGRGMSNEPLDGISGFMFPMTGLPKVQAFCGENGRDRMVFDFRNPDPHEAWQNSGLGYWLSNTAVDPKRRSMCFYAVTSQHWPGMGVHMQAPPCRGVCEFVDGPLIPSLAFELFRKQRIVAGTVTEVFGEVKCWARFENGKWILEGTYRLPDTQEPHRLTFTNFNEFQLPKGMLDGVGMAQFNIQVNPGQRTDIRADMILLDLNGGFFPHVGLTVSETRGIPVIERVKPKTAAFRAGLKPGDEIVRFNGVKRGAAEIKKTLDGIRFGDLLTIVVVRSGEEKAFRFHAE